MRKRWVTLLVMFGCLTHLSAQIAKEAIHLSPNGKGWGVEAEVSERAGTSGNKAVATNGISYHGGPEMRADSVNVYFIWYGNWTNGPKVSDSRTTVNLLNILFGPTRGLGGSGYFKINTTYSDTIGHPSGNISLLASAANNYSRGKQLSDSDILNIVSSTISSRALPKDANGLYFVLTASDVAETSGFCTKYCGWHNSSNIGGADIKFAFVGNPDRCPSACEMQIVSPNGDSGADGMASIMAHEASEAVTDPDLNGWYDSAGNESADKCAWKFGPVTGRLGQGAYNQTFGTYNWLIQMEWENSRGGGCDKVLGGKFYNQ
jgi:Phosphate-induced protein 1 conserved region